MSPRRRRKTSNEEGLVVLAVVILFLFVSVPDARLIIAVGVAAAVGYLYYRGGRARPSSLPAQAAVPQGANQPELPLPAPAVAAIKSGRTSAAPLPYRSRDAFFNWSEGAFYGALVSAVRGRYLIFAKVRLLDVCADLERSQISAFNRISSKHLDFLLCDPATYRPTVGIELDGSSHLRRDRIERDAFVDEVFRGMNVPLIHFRVERTFVPQQIAQRLDDAIGRRPI